MQFTCPHFPVLASQCKTLACSCNKARIPCTEFCGCIENDVDCFNKWRNMADEDDESEDEDVEENEISTEE